MQGPSMLGALRAVRINSTAIDPAIQIDETLFDYAATRDMARLKFKDGCKPDVFVVGALTRPMLVRLMDEPGDASRAHRAFALSCHEIQMGDGVTVLRAEDHGGGLHPGGLARQEWVDAVWDRFGEATIREMGELAIVRARVPEGKGAAFAYPRG